MVVALLLTIGLSADPIWVDRIEINTLMRTRVSVDGFNRFEQDEEVFTQVILWRWSRTYKRYRVAQWIMAKRGGDQFPDVVIGDGFIICSGRVLRSHTIVHTRTFFDPEVQDREISPRRTAYFPE